MNDIDYAYADISDLAQLEDIEDKLLIDLEERPSEETKEALIRLYRRMWELQPDENRYERSIAKLLLELGWDLKRRRVNYGKARRFFEELVKLKKPAWLPIAHYRLGFIHYYNHEWDRAISSFRQALGETYASRAREAVEPWARLDASQTFKAHVRLALACKHRSIEVAKRAAALYGSTSREDESNRIFYQELEAEIAVEEEKPYLCVTVEAAKPMSEREYRLLKERDDAVVLDLTDYAQKKLYVSGVSRLIQGRNLEIMKFLLLRSEATPQHVLEHEIGIRQASVYMNRLKTFLRESGLEEEAIVADNGYKWVYARSYLVYRSDDPDYMF